MAIQTIIEKASGDVNSFALPVLVVDDEETPFGLLAALDAALNVVPDEILGVPQDGAPGFEQLSDWAYRITVRYAPGDIGVIVSERREHYHAVAEPKRELIWASPVARYPNDAFDFQGTIVPDTGVGSTKLGMDVYPGNPNVGISDRVNATMFTPAWRAACLALARGGYVNSSTIAGYPAGTLQMVGFRAQQDGQNTFQVSVDWSYKPNQTGLVIGDVTGVACDGHDLMWTQNRTVADRNSNTLGAVAKAVHVVRPWPRADLSALGISPPPIG